MNIKKAYCDHVSRTIDIVEARNTYLKQDKPRDDFKFYCSSPECEPLTPRVEVTAVNYKNVPVDDLGEVVKSKDKAAINKAYFRKHVSFEHSPDCQWIIKNEAEAEYIKEGKDDDEKRRRRQRVAVDAIIEVSTFLTASEPKPEEPKPTVDSDQPIDLITGKDTRRRNRINRAKEKLRRPKTSSEFSDLVSSFIKIREQKKFDNEITVDNIGKTTWKNLFYPIKWYTPENKHLHVFHHDVAIGTVFPKNFDFKNGLPDRVYLNFLSKVNVHGLDKGPSFCITRDAIESTPGAYVLIEAIRLAKTDETYKDTLSCFFYGAIEKDTRGKNNEIEFLEVIVENLNMIELRTIETRKK